MNIISIDGAEDNEVLNYILSTLKQRKFFAVSFYRDESGEFKSQRHYYNVTSEEVVHAANMLIFKEMQETEVCND